MPPACDAFALQSRDFGHNRYALGVALIEGGTLTSVPGVRVGHWSSTEARTGCTVVVMPEPNLATAEVRGAAPVPGR